MFLLKTRALLFIVLDYDSILAEKDAHKHQEEFYSVVPSLMTLIASFGHVGHNI